MWTRLKLCTMCRQSQCFTFAHMRRDKKEVALSPTFPSAVHVHGFHVFWNTHMFSLYLVPKAFFYSTTLFLSWVSFHDDHEFPQSWKLGESQSAEKRMLVPKIISSFHCSTKMDGKRHGCPISDSRQSQRSLGKSISSLGKSSFGSGTSGSN